MSKTLMYVPGSPTSVKIGDTDTSLYLQVAKDNANVDLTSVKSITVKIADANKNYLKDISITPASLTSGNNGILIVPLNSDNVGGLNSGDYYFEVWIITADSETEIYPDMNVTRFHVFNNLVGGTTVLTTLTMQAFLDRITSTQTASETSLSNSQTALANANTANTNAAKALSDLNAGNYLTKDTLASASSFESLQTQVNNSAVGANLLTGTSSDLQTAPDSSSNVAGGTIHNFNSDELSILTSNQATARAFIHNTTTHTVNLVIWTDKGNLGVGTGVPAGTDGYSTITAYNATSSSTRGDIDVRAYTDNAAISGVQYKELKLEKGSVATDWCPNPAEILTQSDYAKIKAAIVALGGSLS